MPFLEFAERVGRFVQRSQASVIVLWDARPRHRSIGHRELETKTHSFAQNKLIDFHAQRMRDNFIWRSVNLTSTLREFEKTGWTRMPWHLNAKPA